MPSAAARPQLSERRDVVGDPVRDEGAGGAADELGRDVVADRQDEDEDGAGADARHRLREVDPPERGPVGGAERLGRAEVGGRDGLHHRVERQDHERQQDVRHRDDRAGGVVDHRPAGCRRRRGRVQTRMSLMTPCCWRSTFQEAVRTRSEVQNGRSTRMSRRFERAQRQAGEEPGDRVAEHQAGEGDGEAEREGAQEERARRCARARACSAMPSGVFCRSTALRK